MGLASSAGTAAAGAALTDLGYSLVFPGLGVEAVRRAPPESRGVAMGAYTACLDLALGVSGPALGLVAGKAGVSAVFLVSALIVLGAATIAVRLLRAFASAVLMPAVERCPCNIGVGSNPVLALCALRVRFPT
jgi:predicted MFS family arabinose efflux permease